MSRITSLTDVRMTGTDVALTLKSPSGPVPLTIEITAFRKLLAQLAEFDTRLTGHGNVAQVEGLTVQTGLIKGERHLILSLTGGDQQHQYSFSTKFATDLKEFVTNWLRLH